MIYVIISNIGLALITIVMYIRYSHFRISSSLKIRELDKGLKAKKEEKKALEESLRAELKTENEQVKSLLREIEQSRKERQEEIKLRLTAEKQIEIANQKIIEVQNRVKDWQIVQSDTLKSSKEAIFKFGEEMLQKLSSTHKRENDEHRHFIEQNMQDLHKDIIGVQNKVEEFREKISEIKISTIPQNVQNSSAVQNSFNQSQKVQNQQLPKSSAIELDEVAKKSLEDVISLIEVSGLKHFKDYLLSTKLDQNKAKYMLCDLVLIKEKTAYFIDFKADKYFKEYEKLSEDEKENSLPAFKQKIDKYLAYISNPKYKDLIEKLLKALKMDFTEIKIVFAVRNRDDLTVMKELKYFDKASKIQIEIFDVNGINDLVL